MKDDKQLQSAGTMPAPVDPISALLANPQALADLPIEKVERLLAMHERQEEKQAAQAMALARAQFQAECPEILPAKARDRGIKYAPLGYIAKVIAPTLQRHGLSYSWSSEHTMEPRGVLMTCTVLHVSGASTSSQTWMPLADIAKANAAQNQGGTETYARRHSLISALGLTTADPDTDAMLPDEQQELITEEQALNLIALAEELGRSQDKLVEWLGSRLGREISDVADLPAHVYDKAVAQLERMRAKA